MLVTMIRAALAVAIALAAGSGSAIAQSKLATVNVIASPDDAITPVLYAKASGMFERAGLDVEITKGTGGAAVTAAVVRRFVQYRPRRPARAVERAHP